MISRAAGLSKDEIKALRSALQASQAENKQLKAENKTLKEALNKLSHKSAAQQRQVKRSVQGRNIKATPKTTMRVQAPRLKKVPQKGEEIAKKAKMAGKKAAWKAQSEARKKATENMSGEERRNYWNSHVFIPQFIQRIQSYFAGAFSNQQIDLMIKVLNRAMGPKLNKLITYTLQLRSIMYDSDQKVKWGELEGYSPNKLFQKMISSVSELLTPEELIWYKKWEQDFWGSKEGQEILNEEEAQTYQQAKELIEAGYPSTIEQLMEEAGYTTYDPTALDEFLAKHK